MSWIDLEQGQPKRIWRIGPEEDQVRSHLHPRKRNSRFVTGQLGYHVDANPSTTPEQLCLVHTEDHSCGIVSG